MQSVRTPRAMKETVKTRPSREYGVLQHSAMLKRREERACNSRTQVKCVGSIVEKKMGVTVFIDEMWLCDVHSVMSPTV